LLNESRTLQGASAKLAYFYSDTVAGFYAAVDTPVFAFRIRFRDSTARPRTHWFRHRTEKNLEELFIVN